MYSPREIPTVKRKWSGLGNAIGTVVVLTIACIVALVLLAAMIYAVATSPAAVSYVTIYPAVTGKNSNQVDGWILKTTAGDVPVSYSIYMRHKPGDLLKVEQTKYDYMVDWSGAHATYTLKCLEGN